MNNQCPSCKSNNISIYGNKLKCKSCLKTFKMVGSIERSITRSTSPFQPKEPNQKEDDNNYKEVRYV